MTKSFARPFACEVQLLSGCERGRIGGGSIVAHGQGIRRGGNRVEQFVKLALRCRNRFRHLVCLVVTTRGRFRVRIVVLVYSIGVSKGDVLGKSKRVHAPCIYVNVNVNVNAKGRKPDASMCLHARRDAWSRDCLLIG